MAKNNSLESNSLTLSSVQLLSRVRVFSTPWTAACQASLSITNSRSLLKLMSLDALVMPSNHLILCHPLLLLPSILPSIRVFSNESVLLIRGPKHWSFSFSVSPSNEYSGLISFRMDCLDLLAVQGTLKSLLQHYSSKASIHSIETSILSRVKQITSPGWMHETSAQGWCTGKTQRDGIRREAGAGIGMGNTCKSMADSCQCMAKTTTIL